MKRTRFKAAKVFHQVDIIDTADEGLAIGRCADGLIIQVRGAVPGDVIDAQVIEKRKGMFIAKPILLHTLSADRTDPFCSHFGTCGGCKWQHMTYEAQVRFKEKKVHDAFRRIGGLDDTCITPIVHAPLQTYYRNKMEFTASDRRWLTAEEMHIPDITDKTGVGFHLPGAFDKVLDIQHCYLQQDPSNEIRHAIKNICRGHHWTFSNLRHKTGFLRNILVRNTLDGDIMVVLIVGEDDREKIELIVRSLRTQFSRIVSVYSCINQKVNDSFHDLAMKLESGDDGIVETLGHARFKIGPKSFFQTNSMQAATLYAITKKLANLKKSDVVYDLYCGVGSIGIYMADGCARVIGIEQISEAVDDARINARLNDIHNIEFVTGQVELLLDPDFITRHGKPDVVITDPPRAGMHPAVIQALLVSLPERIVYVSCNPATQARDIKMLSESYTLMTAAPVDMFPHTHHIECVALLQKNA